MLFRNIFENNHFHRTTVKLTANKTSAYRNIYAVRKETIGQLIETICHGSEYICQNFYFFSHTKTFEGDAYTVKNHL